MILLCSAVLGLFFSTITIDFTHIFSQLLCYMQILYSSPNISHLFSITWAISRIILLGKHNNVLSFWNEGHLTLGLFGQYLVISVNWHRVVFLLICINLLFKKDMFKWQCYFQDCLMLFLMFGTDKFRHALRWMLLWIKTGTVAS